MVITPPAWLTRQVIEVVLLAALAIGAFFLVRQILQWRTDAHANAAAIDSRDATATAATDIGQDLGEATSGQQRVEVAITTDTRQLAIDLERLRNEKPELDHWLRGDIPSELRELAAERRRARDRLSPAADGGGAADPGAPAPGASDQDRGRPDR